MTAPDAPAPLMKRATYAAVAVAALLIAVKLFGWLLTGSVSVDLGFPPAGIRRRRVGAPCDATCRGWFDPGRVA